MVFSTESLNRVNGERAPSLNYSICEGDVDGEWKSDFFGVNDVIASSFFFLLEFKKMYIKTKITSSSYHKVPVGIQSLMLTL